VRQFAWVALAIMVGCRGGEPSATPPLPPATPPRVAARPAPVAVHALLVNGGGSKAQNYRSHLLHVQQLFAQLERAGVDRSRIAIFSGDGDDADPDVALLDERLPDDFWLVDGTRIEAAVRPPIQYGNTTVDDVPIHPATKAALAEWFETDGQALRPGDVLLLYVTDHGTKNVDDTTNNKITLWGSGENLSVQELSGLLDRLDPGVRVVAVMSQCYSGAFAGLVDASAGTNRQAGNVCGYFASTAERPAYGCYPENRGRDNVGHSFHFLDAFARTGRLAAAHDEVLVADATPDVPLRSSDVYLETVVRRAADAAHSELSPFVDALLETAWRDRAAWEPEIRELDRIGAAFGIFSPRSLQELDEQSQRIDAMADQLKTHGGAWQHARESLARANLDRFVKAHPEWTERLDDKAPPGTARPTPADLATTLLPAMAEALAADPVTDERFTTLRDRADRAKEIGYRMEVRQGVVLRMRALLLAVAGRVQLAEQGTPQERDTYAAIRTCENLAIPPAPPPAGTELARAEPFPVLADDVAIADSVLPAWMGIQFRQAKEGVRKKHDLSDGAAGVMMVYDDSPAKAAGLKEGDVILGPPDAHFQETEQIREWVMRSPPGIPTSLDVLRDGKPELVTLVPQAMPQKWPSLPGPPKVGSTAPPIRLGHYRGAAPPTLADGRPHLLFFWATWCAICKKAVPELLAFERERQVQVVAITDETATELDPFFTTWKEEFPSVVASDETRAAFRSYGVSGTPSFVLVDGKGIVQHVATGYTKKKGLGIDGWHWDGLADTDTGG
jgi:thiol-disulfide isomerase/thioredoxin